MEWMSLTSYPRLTTNSDRQTHMPHFSHAGFRHYFCAEGDSRLPAVLLLHPVGANMALWDKVADRLLAHAYVIRLDLRGHGGTDTPAQPFTVDDLAQDAVALADALEIGTFTVAGISLGAMVALKLASLIPHRVVGLMTCSASPQMTPPPDGWDARIAAAVNGGMAALADGMVARMFSAEFVASRDPYIAKMRTIFEHTDPIGYGHALRVLGDTDLWPVLPHVTCPALVIAGARDPLISKDVAQRLASSLPSGELLTLDCGHFPPLEAPDAVSDAFIGLLRRLPS